jgi:hypothetical protein
MVIGNLQNKKEEGDPKKKNGKKNLENVEKFEVLGNFRRKKKMGRGLGGV